MDPISRPTTLSHWHTIDIEWLSICPMPKKSQIATKSLQKLTVFWLSERVFTKEVLIAQKIKVSKRRNAPTRGIAQACLLELKMRNEI